MVEIFASYNREEKSKVEKIVEALRNLKFNVWFDDDINPNEVIVEKVNTNLSNCNIVLVIWSLGAVKSKWVLGEADIALKNEKIVQVLIDDCNIPAPFNTLPTYNLISWSGETDSQNWKEVALAIAKHMNRHSLREWFAIRDTNSSSEYQKWALKYVTDPLAEFAWKKIQDLEIKNLQKKLLSRKKVAERDFLHKSNNKNDSDELDNIETEIKYGANNLQAKYLISGDPRAFSDTISFVLTKMGFSVESEFQNIGYRRHIDTYYDDINGTLQFNQLFLRVREIEGLEERKVTLKSLVDIGTKVSSKILTRSEYDLTLSQQELIQLIEQPEALVKTITDNNLNLRLDKLHGKFSIFNKRADIIAIDSEEEYRISLDKYYIHDPKINFYSEYYDEVEIECSPTAANSKGLIEICNALENMAGTGLKSHKIPKYEKAMNWLSQPDIRSPMKLAIGIEIIEFESMVQTSQQQSLQILNKLIKDNLRHSQKESLELEYIATGAGFVIMPNEEAIEIIELSLNLQNAINDYIEDIPLAQDFEVGIAIDYGHIFKYSDFNRRVNFGGALIKAVVKQARLSSNNHYSISEQAIDHISKLHDITPEFLEKLSMYRKRKN